jgi:hypothetical protein
MSMLSHENNTGTLQNVHMPLSIGVIGEFLRLNFDKENIKSIFLNVHQNLICI